MTSRATLSALLWAPVAARLSVQSSATRRGFGFGLRRQRRLHRRAQGKDLELPAQTGMLIRTDNTITVPVTSASNAALPPVKKPLTPRQKLESAAKGHLRCPRTAHFSLWKPGLTRLLANFLFHFFSV